MLSALLLQIKSRKCKFFNKIFLIIFLYYIFCCNVERKKFITILSSFILIFLYLNSSYFFASSVKRGMEGLDEDVLGGAKRGFYWGFFNNFHGVPENWKFSALHRFSIFFIIWLSFKFVENLKISHPKKISQGEFQESFAFHSNQGVSHLFIIQIKGVVFSHQGVSQFFIIQTKRVIFLFQGVSQFFDF